MKPKIKNKWKCSYKRGWQRIAWDKSQIFKLDENQENIPPSPLRVYANQYMQSFRNDIDLSCIEFLKSQGYRPKLTKKYFNNLKKKLLKKGIALTYKVNYGDIVEKDNTYSFNYSIEWKFAPILGGALGTVMIDEVDL